MEETPHVDHRLAQAAHETDRYGHQVIALVYQRLLDQSPIPQRPNSSLPTTQSTSNVAAQLQEATS